MSEAKKNILQQEVEKGQKEVIAMARVQAHASNDVNWNVVRLIVEGFTEKFPEDVIGCIEAIKQERKTLVDKKFGTTGGDSDMRQLMKLPNRLQIGLQTQYPTIFTDDKNLKKFLKMYHCFLIPEKL